MPSRWDERFDFKLTLMAYPGSSKAVPWQSTVPFSANESFDFMATFISFVLFLLFGGHPSMTVLGDFVFNILLIKRASGSNSFVAYQFCFISGYHL